MIFDIFNGKRVLITGHTGFKGSWLAIWLHALGAEVHGYSLPSNTNPNNYDASKVHDLLKSECLNDIRNRETFTEYIHKVKPECIFHLAAQPIVRKSYSEPVETFDANVMGSIYLMDAVRTMNSPCTVIMITSDKCYENTGKKDGYVETDPMGGYDPYSASKGCAELAISSYMRSFFNPEKISEHNVRIASVRAGNVIGGGDWAEDRIIPDAVRAVTSGKSLEIRSPGAIRPWQHVLEPLSGYMLLAAEMMSADCGKAAEYCGGFNFGPDSRGAATVSELIDKFYELWGAGDAVYDPEKAGLHEAALLTLSSNKAKKILGWMPSLSFNEAAEYTARWYRSFYAGSDAGKLCNEDIERYTRSLKWKCD